MAVRKIIVASYSSEIVTLSFDPSTTPPSISVSSALEIGHHPSWITPHLTDKTVVFTATEEANGVVKALKYDLESGVGSIIAEASSGGADPCHLAISEKDLVIANYSGSSVTVFPLASTLPYLPSQFSQLVQFSGSGPVSSRQGASHPHQVVVHPEGNQLFIPDLGADKTWRLQRNGPQQWAITGELAAPPGSGPRHGVVLGDNLYVLLELSNEIATHRLGASLETGSTPFDVDVVPTMSNPPPDALSMDPPPLSAEILSPQISSEFPKQYLYVTNRNDRDSGGDILAVFEVLASGTPKLVNEVRTGLYHLRGIAFDEQARYLIAGGAFGHGVKVFERTDGGANLIEVASLKDVQNPTGFHWLSLRA